MNTGVFRKSWLSTTMLVLPVITILLFGLSGGWLQANSWISGAAIGCVEVVIISFIVYMISRGSREGVPTPFYIAAGALVGLYALAVLLEVILFGYLFQMSGGLYFTTHLVTIIAFALVMGLIALFGRYAGNQERRENGDLNEKKETIAWVKSIRAQLQTIPDLPNQSDLLAQMKALEDVLYYSDPIVPASMYEIKQVLRQNIALLEDQVKLIASASKDQTIAVAEEAGQLIRKITGIVEERNAQLLKVKSGASF